MGRRKKKKSSKHKDRRATAPGTNLNSKPLAEEKRNPETHKAIKDGEELFSQDKILEAEELFLSLLKDAPQNADILNNLGVICHRLRRIPEGIEYFKKAFEADPLHQDAQENLLALFEEENLWEESVFLLQKIVTLNSTNHVALNRLALAQMESGDIDGAIRSLMQSHKLNPDQEDIEETLRRLEQSRTQKHAASNKPLNILFVQEAPCIRNYKMATALSSRGHRVSLAYTKAKLSQMYKGLSDDTYAECIQFTSYRQLWDLTGNYDIVHCHNEPDTPTVAALAGRTPVVHDTHDLISLRANNDPNLSYFEGIANRGAAGRVYTTPYQRDEAKALYGIDGPSLVLYNYVSQGDLPKRFLPKLSESDGETHIVYEGGVGGTAHRDFWQLFQELAQHSIHIHIYPTARYPDLKRQLKKHPFLHYHEPVSPQDIMTEMTLYDFGIIPFNLKKGNKRFLDSTIANKLFEYLAARLPVLASPLKTYIDYFKNNPVGLVFESAEDIIQKIPALNKMRETIDFSKQIFTYENEVYKLEEYYYYILDALVRTQFSV